MILLTYWKQIILALGMSVLLLFSYNSGYNSAEQKYAEIIRGYQLDVSNKIDSIEASSNSLVEIQKESSERLAKSIDTITLGLKGKSLVIIKNGECTPSATFSDSLGSINKRVNESLK